MWFRLRQISVGRLLGQQLPISGRPLESALDFNPLAGLPDAVRGHVSPETAHPDKSRFLVGALRGLLHDLPSPISWNPNDIVAIRLSVRGLLGDWLGGPLGHGDDLDLVAGGCHERFMHHPVHQHVVVDAFLSRFAERAGRTRRCGRGLGRRQRRRLSVRRRGEDKQGERQCVRFIS